MKTRYRLIQRDSRGQILLCVYTTGKRSSLHTANADEAKQLIEARVQPFENGR